MYVGVSALHLEKKRAKLFNAAVQGTLTLSTGALPGSCRFYSHVYVAEIPLEPFRDRYLQRGEKYVAVIVLVRNSL